MTDGGRWQRHEPCRPAWLGTIRSGQTFRETISHSLGDIPSTVPLGRSARRGTHRRRRMVRNRCEEVSRKASGDKVANTSADVSPGIRGRSATEDGSDRQPDRFAEIMMTELHLDAQAGCWVRLGPACPAFPRPTCSLFGRVVITMCPHICVVIRCRSPDVAVDMTIRPHPVD